MYLFFDRVDVHWRKKDGRITPQHSNLRRVKRSVFARREPDTFASRDEITRTACMRLTVLEWNASTGSLRLKFRFAEDEAALRYYLCNRAFFNDVMLIGKRWKIWLGEMMTM